MDSFAEEAIQELVCVDQKVVTAVTIARHLDKPVAKANKILIEFYDKYKKEKSLLAVFSISGQMDRNGTPCSAVVLAKQQNLDEVKANFTDIESVDVFAVHLNEIETVSQALAHDILEDDKFFRDDAARAEIKCSKVGAFRKEMETKHSEVAKQLDKVIQAQSEVKKEAPVMEKAKEKKETKKSDISKAFEKACKRDKTPKNSPAKVRPSPFSSEKKAKKEEDEEESPQPKPKRARKIIIDDEDEDEVKQKVEKPVNEKKAAKSKIVDDDLFEAESPEKDPGFTKTTTPVKEEPKRKKAEKTKKEVKDENHEAQPLRRSPRKQQPAGKRKVMKKVIETFADEDGFLVTKEVLREVSVEPTEEEPAPPKPLSPKKANPVVAAPKAKKAAAPTGQSKISSFFTKK